nr:MAG TPA: hypothetical protein [Caudoviricetes sp.]
MSNSRAIRQRVLCKFVSAVSQYRPCINPCDTPKPA